MCPFSELKIRAYYTNNEQGTCCLLLAPWLLNIFSALKFVAACSSETSVYFYWAARSHISEYCAIHSHHCENLVSSKCLVSVNKYILYWNYTEFSVRALQYVAQCYCAAANILCYSLFVYPVYRISLVSLFFHFYHSPFHVVPRATAFPI